MDQEQIYQEQIEAVNILIYEAGEKLRDLESQKRNLFINRYQMRTGLKIGDVVTWKEWVRGRGEVIKKGRITEFHFTYGRVAPNVSIFNKDGQIGKLSRNYWSGSTQPAKI